MAVYLDDEQVDLPGERLCDILDAAQQRVRERGRWIVEVELAGEALTGAALEAASALPPPQGQELRLTSADPRQLLGQAIEQVRAELGGCRAEVELSAELLQQDRREEAMAGVRTLLAAWQSAQQVVSETARLMGLDLDAMSLDGQPVRQRVAALATQLQGLQAQVKAGDDLGLADALAYEWPETLDQWQDMLGELRELLQGL